MINQANEITRRWVEEWLKLSLHTIRSGNRLIQLNGPKTQWTTTDKRQPGNLFIPHMLTENKFSVTPWPKTFLDRKHKTYQKTPNKNLKCPNSSIHVLPSPNHLLWPFKKLKQIKQ